MYPSRCLDRTIRDLATHPWPYVTVAALAAYLQVPTGRLYHHIQKGALPVLSFGGSCRIPIQDACAYADVIYHGTGEVPPSTIPPEWCGGIYFIAGGDVVKIGRARYFRPRLSSLYTQCPVELQLLAVLEIVDTQDAARTEQEIHAHLTTAHVKGEWFQAAAVRTFIETDLDSFGGGGGARRPPAHDLSPYQSWLTPRHASGAVHPHPAAGSGAERAAS